MAQDNMFQGEMDPEIAAMLGTDVKAKSNGGAIPDYSHLFGETAPVEDIPDDAEPAENIDLTAERFPEISKQLEDAPHNFFNDPLYYKTALSGEGDIAQRVHTIFQKFLNTKDPKDRGVYRQQFITAYWEFLLKVARKAPGKLPDPKKYLLRFGLLHPTLLNNEHKNLFARVVTDNTWNMPIYYLDEWFKAVGTGLIRNSTTDEVRVVRSNTSIRLQQLLDKAQGKMDGVKGLLKAKDEERTSQEKNLYERIANLADHTPLDGLPDVSACYSEGQKRIFAEIQENLKNLIKTDHELGVFIRDYYQAEQDVNNLRQKVEEEGAIVEVDLKALDTEFDSVRQMVKMTVGRQGNHFPVLTSE